MPIIDGSAIRGSKLEQLRILKKGKLPDYGRQLFLCWNGKPTEMARMNKWGIGRRRGRTFVRVPYQKAAPIRGKKYGRIWLNRTSFSQIRMLGSMPPVRSGEWPRLGGCAGDRGTQRSYLKVISVELIALVILFGFLSDRLVALQK
jgi:hypothetical protein